MPRHPDLHRAEPALSRPTLRLRMRVTCGASVALGPGKVALLETLRQTHSINAAAKQLGMSYRRAWQLVDEINASLREPAVVSAVGGSHGGGSQLTAVGEAVVATYRRIEQAALAHCARDVERLLAQFID